MWLFFAVMAPFFWGMANPVDAALRRNWLKDDLVMTGFFALTKLPVALGLIVVFGQGIVFGWPVFWMFCQGVIWMLAFVFYYRAMQIEEVSRVVLLLQFQPIMMLILGRIFLGENLAGIQFVAFALILFGSVLAALKKNQAKWHFSNAFLLVLIADLMWSVADIFFKRYQVFFPNFWSAFGVDLLGSSLLGALLFFIPKYKTLLSGFKLSKMAWGLIFFSSLFGTLGSLVFAYALTLGNVALTSVIIGLQPLFALMSGISLNWFIKEVPKESIRGVDLLIKGVSFALIFWGLIVLYL